MLLKAVNTYGEAAELPDTPHDLIKATLKRRADRQQFLGTHTHSSSVGLNHVVSLCVRCDFYPWAGRTRGSLATLEKLSHIFPEDITVKNDLGVAYLIFGDNKSAKRVYEEVRCSSCFCVCEGRVKRETNVFMIPPKVLSAAPNDGFAKVHYGFILKSENKIEESIPYLRVMLTHSLTRVQRSVNMLTDMCFFTNVCLCLGGFGIWRSRYWWWKVLLSPGRCVTADGR